MEQKKLVILGGPTAVGKSDISVKLAKKIGGEVISADSMQVYKGCDIGSAKLSPEEMEGVPHYLIDVLDPTEEFDVARFQQMAKEALETIYSHGHIPILVGGTGFYIQALLYDIDFTEQEKDAACREQLKQYADEHGEEALHEKLAQVDPEAAEAIHPHNVKRVIRALEYYQQSGEKISAHNKQEREKKSPYDFRYFVLTDDRERLKARIDARVDQMIEDGLVEEVRKLKEAGCKEDMTSMQGLGYKEILDYLNGACSLEEAVCRIKQSTRRYAKRQLTWFRREPDVIWIDRSQYADENAVLQVILQNLKDW